MRRRALHAVCAAVLLVVGLVVGTAAAPAGDAVESYIVVLERGTPNVQRAAADLARAYGGQVGFVYEDAIQGFSVRVSERGAAALARNPLVAYVEKDMVRSIDAQTVPTGIERILADDNGPLDIDGTDDYRVDVDVAVIDTGVDFEHPDLNVMGGINCANGNPFRAKCLAGGDDDHYHGTHVAGTIGAIDNGIGVVGVAPGARIWAVKVLNSQGSGYASWIVAGIDWVAANASTIEVANMSLGGSGFSQAEYDAIQNAVSKGVAFAVSAGNSDADARSYSPAAFDNVLTVSALADFDGIPGGLGSPTCRTDQDDTLADFSNWGPAVDIAAPGVCILSTFPIERGEYGTISGTSMASPHVAGALALLASVDNPANATGVYKLYDQVKDAGNGNWTDDSGDGIPEPLLDVSNTTLFAPTMVAGGGGEPPANTPQMASFTYECSGMTCTFTNTSSDSDGSVVAWVWSFGDGNTSTVPRPSHTYPATGTFTVTLTVTDDDTATASTSHQVSVTDPSSGFTLTVNAYKVKGAQSADLTWSGASSTDVEVYRSGGIVATTVNDGFYTDATGQKGGGSATYRVCEKGTTTCSNEVSVSW